MLKGEQIVEGRAGPYLGLANGKSKKARKKPKL